MGESKPGYKQINDDKALIVTGETLDNNNAHEMVEAVTSAQTREFKFIIVDMADLEFLSSSGVGSILGTVEISRDMQGDIVLCNVSGTILHVLEVLDLADFLTIKSTMQDAVAMCE